MSMKLFNIILYILIIFILNTNISQCCELILPKEKHSIVNTQYIFFVGYTKENEKISLNDEHVFVAKNGAFAHSVKLNDGENRIILTSGVKRQIYKVYKEPEKTTINTEFTEFIPRLYKVINDNVPLRSTPIDYGMNRLSHLFKNTVLVIDGEKGDFYRVFLNKDYYCWINKKDVCLHEQNTTIPDFITMECNTFKNATVHTIKFTDKLPYIINETDKEIIFKVFNPQMSENTVYTINIDKPQKYMYKLKLSDGTYQLKINKILTSETNNLQGLTIAVDAGHGGLENGAVGCLGDKEKDINLKIALELKQILANMGANVVMTRECDANVSLDERVKIAKNEGADIFVSIHLNSIGDIKMNINKNKGSSVFYYNKNSEQLAKCIEKKLVSTIKAGDDGIKTASFAVIRPTDYIGVLVEAAYMTNPKDSLIYTSDDFPYNTAKGIADGILSFIISE